MAGKYQAYPEYKDSEAQWLGDVPLGWDIIDGKRLFKNRRELSLETDEQLAASQKYGVVPQSLMMDLNDSKVMLALNGTSSFRHVEVNDFVISLRSFEGGIEHSNYIGCVSPAYTVLSATKEIEPCFYRYLFKSKPYIAALQSTTDSLRDGKSITFDQFGAIPLVMPKLNEQEQISNFLDHETAKIDTLIEKQQQLIKLLKEKRQAVISHAVTKGLNPKAPMRDSGVEWLGEVPAHWVIKKLKFACSFITKKVDIGNKKTIALENIESWSGKYIATDSVYAGEDVEFKSGDILFGKLRPYLAKVYFAKEDGVAFGDLLVYRAKPNLLGKYCFYQMINEAFINTVDSSTYGSKMPRASADFINEMEVLLPPIQEQEAIVTHIEFVLYKYNEVEAKAKSAINLLQERRTALISAAVTGKIDVRHWQAPEPLNNTGNKALAA